MGLLIKLESKGAIFFVQKRNGLNNEEFDCFKFRSMVVRNYVDNNQTTKNDARLTKVGKFIRKTSIDELPQFLNVFLGEMSVIGPRPHMVKHNIDHSSKINQFTVRTYVKPGITGLAQVKGYRGEIRTDKDIINRVRYDLFYIENWTFLLDIKIVLLTVFNVFKGEENAY
jgi:putative colanic acid biosynthesis UDP-glucose lipid carrier transferase